MPHNSLWNIGHGLLQAYRSNFVVIAEAWTIFSAIEHHQKAHDFESTRKAVQVWSCSNTSYPQPC